MRGFKSQTFLLTILNGFVNFVNYRDKLVLFLAKMMTHSAEMFDNDRCEKQLRKDYLGGYKSMRIRKWKSFILSIMLAVLMAVACLAGCGKQSATSPPVQGGGDFTEISGTEDLSLLEDFTEYNESESPQSSVEEDAGNQSEESFGYKEETKAESSGNEEESKEDLYGESPDDRKAATAIDRDGTYTTKDDVALYIHTYGELPDNFITKKQAKKLGWTGGSLESYAPGKCIGGDYFGNYEGLKKKKKGREYHECDIDTLGKSKRGARRIIFSNDGLIYYTGDHYEHFELLYGEE